MSDEAFPIVTVEDMPSVMPFYEQLGFTQQYRFPSDGEPEFVTLTRGASTIGLAAGDPSTDRYSYWVYVENVDETVAALSASGAVVVTGPEDQPWGERIARVRDPAGTTVVLGAPI